MAVAVTPNLEDFAAECGLNLERYQVRIAKAMNGPERECVVSIPRGNGKTSLTALVALHHFVTVDDAKVYCAAASEQQASLLFEYAADYARVLALPNIVFRHHELRWCPDPDKEREFTRHMRVRASDAPKLHGLTFSLGVLDEMQALPDNSVYEALATALYKRPDAKLVVISTAAQGADSPLGRLRARALGLPNVSRKGAVTDARGDSMRFLEWACSEDDDVDDPKVVKVANPASWISVSQLKAAREALPDIAFRRFIANQWVGRESSWLPVGAYQRCVGTPRFTPGEKLWLGVDIGGERSTSAVAWVNETLNAGVGIYEGEDGILEVLDHVRELAKTYDVREIAFDPWRFGQAAAELEREGLVVTAWPQHDQRMIPASSRLHAAIVEGRITLPDDPRLAQHAANSVAKHSRRGWRIDKPNPRTPNDAIIALAIAVDAMENQPEPVRLLGWL
jgi:phage terminase large subunit-like protein